MLLNLTGFECQSAIRKPPQFDVLVYSARPAGISAAIFAARQGMRVQLVDPSKSLNVESFLFVHGKFPAIRTGFYREISDSVRKIVQEKISNAMPDSQFLAKTYSKVIERLLKKNGISTHFGFVPDSSQKVGLTNRKMLGSVTFCKKKNPQKKLILTARLFIDASKAGELMTRFPCRFHKRNTLDSEWEMKMGSPDSDFDTSSKEDQILQDFYQLEGMHWLSMIELRSSGNRVNAGIQSSSIGVGVFDGIPEKVISIPFGIMVPVGKIPLLCPGPISGSLTVSKLMEHPVNQMVLGQASGMAAAVCVKGKFFPNILSIDSLQSLLVQNRMELIYLTDIIPETDVDFEVFQKLALLNCFSKIQVGLNEDWIQADWEWLAERTGFSINEISEFTKGKSKREGLLLIWKSWERANRGQL